MPGILARLLGRTETRDAASMSASYASAFGIHPTASGAYVNPRLAENLATVTACIGAVASAMASLPPYVYRGAPGGRTELPDHPVARLTRRPNGNQTWPDWMEWLLSQVLAHGNAICAIEYDGAGRPSALVPIPWGNVQMFLLPSGRLAYDVVQYVAPWGGTGRPRRLLDGEVFHLRDRSDDGLTGRSRISRAPEVLGNAIALQDWNSAMWQNQATPSGAVEIEASLNEPQFQRLRAQFERTYTGTHNARRVLILDNKAKWQALSVSPEDAEVLASRRFSVEELCRLYQVPPPIVQDYTHNTFTNSQQAALWFAQFSLAPWAKKIEAEFSRSVFGASSTDCSLEIDLSGLMRGDYEARWKAHEIAVRNDILDRNEVREIEGYNPRAEAPAANA
jgi:HK97 family phage portal protein